MPRTQTTDKFSPHDDLRADRGRRGFTLIEILIAISVIFILMAIVFVALKHSASAGKSAQTRVTLLNLQAMYDELEATGGTKSQPAGWFWWQAGNLDGNDDGYIESGSPIAPSFWTMPLIIGGMPDAMSAPGLMGENSSDTTTLGGNLVGSPAVLNTQLAMSVILASSNNRQAFEKLPQDQKMTLPYVASQQFAATNALIDYGWLGYVNGGTPSNVVYAVGNRVNLNSVIYRAIGAAGAPVVTTAPPGTPWKTDTRDTPILKDGWGHPIIFVPSGGLRVRLLNGSSTYNPADKSQCVIVIAPPGKTTLGTTAPNLPVVIAPGRPFFASAGPDGDFSRGDDNIYSFDSQ